MSDYFAVLEQDLVDAARRRSAVRPLRRRPPPRSFLLAAALALLVAGSAMAGTLYILRGDPIPAPAERDAGASQTVEPGSSHVLPMRADDPAGGPKWALRVGRSRTGAICSTVGQEVGGEFGVIGLDNRFRPLAEGAVDSCGLERRGTATLVGARVMDARNVAGVRTLVSGVAGNKLRDVRVLAGGRNQEAKIGPGGTFILALSGYPENLGVDVRLRFANGLYERHALGVSPYVVGDPTGDRAWETESFSGARENTGCVVFGSARERGARSQSPAACGTLRDVRRPRGYYFAVRLLKKGRSWRAPARTAVWGAVGEDVRRIQVITPGQTARTLAIPPSRAVLAVLAGDVPPDRVRVRVVLRDGSVHEHTGDTNLLPAPKGFR
jgi:hypothetical protein